MTRLSLQEQLSSLLKGGRLQVPAAAVAALAATRVEANNKAGLRPVKLKFSRATAGTGDVPPQVQPLPTDVEVPVVTPVQQLLPPAADQGTTTVMEAKTGLHVVKLKTTVVAKSELTTEKLRMSIAKLAVRESEPEKHKRLVTASVRAKDFAAQIKAYSKGRSTPELREAVNAAGIIANSLVSIREAHEAYDASEDDLKQVQATCGQHLEKIEAWFVSATAAPAKVEAVNLKNMPTQHFQQYLKFKSRLPSAASMKREKLRFKRLVSPVVVIFNNPMAASSQVLDDLGFEVTSDGDYVVMHGQEIWAVATEVLQESDAWEGDEELYIKRCLATYQRRTGVKGVVLGTEHRMKIGHPSTPGISYYWVMPERQFKALPSSLKEWGFPF